MVNKLVFDTETTGLDVFNDRIVQLSAMKEYNGKIVKYDWLIDPGVEVPEEASDIHGFTTEVLREKGIFPSVALKEFALLMLQSLREGCLIVAYNMSFDLSMLEYEMKRHKIVSNFASEVSKGKVYDPLVIDRGKDRYRKGSRKLEFVSQVYGVPFEAEKAHKADYDTEVTFYLTDKMYDKFGMVSKAEQQQMHKTWAASLQDYLHRLGKTEERVNGEWPYRR